MLRDNVIDDLGMAYGDRSENRENQRHEGMDDEEYE